MDMPVNVLWVVEDGSRGLHSTGGLVRIGPMATSGMAIPMGDLAGRAGWYSDRRWQGCIPPSWNPDLDPPTG